MSKPKSSVFMHIYRRYRSNFNKNNTKNIWQSLCTLNIKSFFNNSLLFYITIINLLLIVITTPSIVNPGPTYNDNSTRNLKVAYCNVQGFILMSSMRGSQPIFQTNKLLDFQSFVHTEKPDIVVIIIIIIIIFL